MLENLLHAQIVLSKSQLADLHGGGVATKSNIAGEITLIGVEDQERRSVQVLVRFDPELLEAIEDSLKYAPYPVYCISIVEKVFRRGERTMLVGQDGVERVLVTTILKVALRNPQMWLRACAQRLAKALINAYHDRCAWQATDFRNDMDYDESADPRKMQHIGKELGLI